MSTPPAKKIKVNSASGEGDVDTIKVEEECTTISMIVEKGDCVSPITRIKGYPWRLRLFKNDDGYYKLFVRCEKSVEAELWDTEAHIKLKDPLVEGNFKCSSICKQSQEHLIGVYQFTEGTRVEVEIKPCYDGNEWNCRPVVGFLDPRDGIIVIENKKFYVNKKSLTSLSYFFKCLFTTDTHKKNNDNEFPVLIDDLTAEEFTNLMKMVYGENGISVVDDILTRQNVYRFLDLARICNLEIVKDGIVNTLLSSSSPLSIHEKLLLVEEYGLPGIIVPFRMRYDLKNRIISQYTDVQLKELSESPLLGRLPAKTMYDLFKKSCDALTKANEQHRG